MIREGRLPPKEAVRIEEMVNNFRYNYPLPQDDPPFSITTSLGDCPWNNNHQLLKVGLKGRIDENRPDVNLVFLLDVSGSMNSRDKLPLLKKSFKLLLDALRPTDTVAIVAYAGHTGVVLAPTKANERQKISEAMDKLQATGSTNGTGGLQLAYQLAQQKFSADSVNRVILATDGDFNVGISDHNKLQDFIEEKRKTGIELSVLGFGRGNVKDDTMELLANKGNGNYNYIDTVRSARKALVEEMASNLITIAKDVKIQMVFDPERVQSFRLIGYENRALAHRDFKDDTKDAGELGMGHTVTALYEIIPIQNISDHHPSIGRVKLRYKSPKGSSSQLVQKSISATTSGDRDQNFLWAIATAGWGEILRDSSHVNKEHLNRLITLARSAKGNDPMGYRSEMIQLMEISKDLLFLKNDEQLPLWQYRE
jgi:Ca-activated chloride channel family protein